MYIQSPVKAASTPKKSSKAGFLGGAFFLFLCLIIVGAFFIYSQYNKALNIPNSESSETVSFTITPGESSSVIAQNLVEKGLLNKSDLLFFRAYLRQSGSGSQLQAGEFQIPLNLTMVELVDALKRAHANDVTITIIEGLRADEIAQVFETEFAKVDPTIKRFSQSEYLALVTDQGFISELGLSTNTLEGYLFPDQYKFFEDATAADVIKSQIDHFKSQVGTSYTNEDIIIASLVERESRTDDERPLVADIIKRRNDEGWFLNIDASLLYHKGDWNHVLTLADIEEDQPYNTYTNLGLPPTPICNPGLSSIKAALNPEPNNYYYYIHEDSGQVHFAETLEEHNQNILNYLQ